MCVFVCVCVYVFVCINIVLFILYEYCNIKNKDVTQFTNIEYEY